MLIMSNPFEVRHGQHNSSMELHGTCLQVLLIYKNSSNKGKNKILETSQVTISNHVQYFEVSLAPQYTVI